MLDVDHREPSAPIHPSPDPADRGDRGDRGMHRCPARAVGSRANGGRSAARALHRRRPGSADLAVSVAGLRAAHRTDGRDRGACGGSILNATTILTAAHCVDHEHTTSTYPASDFEVVAGASNVASVVSHAGYPPGSQHALVSSIRTHPYYVVTPTEIRDDVAVLTLREPLTLSAPRNAQAIGLVRERRDAGGGNRDVRQRVRHRDGAPAPNPTTRCTRQALTAVAGYTCGGLELRRAAVRGQRQLGDLPGRQRRPADRGQPRVLGRHRRLRPRRMPGRAGRRLLEPGGAGDTRLHRRQRNAAGRRATDLATGDQVGRAGPGGLRPADLRTRRMERLAVVHLHLPDDPDGSRRTADAPERAERTSTFLRSGSSGFRSFASCRQAIPAGSPPTRARRRPRSRWTAHRRARRSPR